MKDTPVILPYSLIVGQEGLKLSLELAYIAPKIGGVLISGHRGTGKSTAVRAFASMMYEGRLPITLPINATEEFQNQAIEKVMNGQPVTGKNGVLTSLIKKFFETALEAELNTPELLYFLIDHKLLKYQIEKT